jgi:D-alanyl-D-alanine carboxypeptidase/D-alanyl-D-alanine-endopeptidase (penicillin-binding protein 4)
MRSTSPPDIRPNTHNQNARRLMRRLRIGLALGLSWGAVAGWAQNGALAPEAGWPPPLQQALKQSGVPAQAVSLLAWPVGAPEPRWQHLPDQPRQAASVMKLFTTGVALRQLGPAHVWRTEVALGGPLRTNGVLDGPLHLRGGGDPALLIEHLQRMMARWRDAGLRDIRGGIVIDRSLFALPPHDPAAFDGQALKPYNAGPDALLLNHQAVTLRLMADAARPGQAKVALDPPLHGVHLEQKVTLSSAPVCGDWRGALKLDMAPMAGWPHGGRARWAVRLSGSYPAACGEKEWPLLWTGDGAGDHTARVLEAAWQTSGGQLGAPVSEGAWPNSVPVWQTWVSPPLASVVRDINKFSNNVMARQLFLTLGTPLDARGPATIERARSVVSEHVQQATGSADSTCRDAALVLDNGSGLSRQEQSSARCMGQWLQAMWRSPVMPEFIASLPLNGVDGTTRRWQAAAGQAHIKTGSLDGVASVAGYVLGESGQRIVIVGLINHPRADAARPLLQALVDWARQDR